jgi:hypothetical protein
MLSIPKKSLQIHSIRDNQDYLPDRHSGRPSGLVEADPIEDPNALDGIQDVRPMDTDLRIVYVFRNVWTYTLQASLV